MHSSKFWKNHFAQNIKIERIDWGLKPDITNIEKDQILYSLKAWQLGETSDGRHLLAAATKHAKKHNDPEYLDSINFFIKEEQKHGENLGKYIHLIGEKTIKRDWGDYLFRKVRYLNTSMELWTVSVIIVESAAQIFYKALSDSTNCKLLKSICSDILIDEAHHIKFQNDRLLKIFESKKIYSKAIRVGLYGLLFFGTIHAIWYGHKNVFKAGRISKNEFMRKMYYKFFNSLKYAHSTSKIESTQTA